MSETVLDRVQGRLLQALSYNPNVSVSPIALLWPDGTGQWKPLVERIGSRAPVVTLGAYDPKARIGPAYWIRCVVMRTLDAGLAEGTPIVYLPGVTRNELRAVEDASPSLAPICELQYRSQWFSHPNGKDWTARAFLTHSEGGLGLRVAEDPDSAEALVLALGRLGDVPFDGVNSQLLDAEFFRDLINPDPVRNVLYWLDHPAEFKAQMDDAQWAAFVQKCKAVYKFDPATSGELSAARSLGQRKGAWAEVWKRFAEAPTRYPQIPQRLRQAKPMELLFEPDEAWPQDNDAAEDQVRNQLLDFAVLTPEGARKAAKRLESEHSWRRATVWAELDRSPLAFALEQLAALADYSTQPLAEGDLKSLVDDYIERGWRADDAALRALAAAPSGADRSAVASAVSSLYRTWIQAGAQALLKLIGPMANADTYRAGPQAVKTDGVVTLFVDGLRTDIAHRVAARLVGAGLGVKVESGLAALPPVTETAKAALIPVEAGKLVSGPDLFPRNAATGTKATLAVLRALMTEGGVQVLDAHELGDPQGTGWTEAGDIDHHGHDGGLGMVDYLEEEAIRVTARVRDLLGAGWRRVDIVTDHGWILMPGGMEKVDLPVAVTEKKKGRCARLKPGAQVDVPTIPWYWDSSVSIAIAPGITCFEANKEYEHGGVTPQECIVPRLMVTAGAHASYAVVAELTTIKWLGLLCRVEYVGLPEGTVIDLRTLPGAAASSVADRARAVGGEGKVTLAVSDEGREGENAYLVAASKDGQILLQREVVLGQNR
jgi:hypothetical protein